jgi:hypothetical protein
MTFDHWSWIKIMTHFWVWCNNIPIHAFSENLWPEQCLNHYDQSDLDLWLITFNQGHYTFFRPGQQSCEILVKFIRRVRNYGLESLFACFNHYVHSDLDFALGSTLWHLFVCSITILWNIIPIHKLSEKLWFRQCKNHYV